MTQFLLRRLLVTLDQESALEACSCADDSPPGHTQ
jgi:hypothetical protein